MKVVICKRLDEPKLPGPFATHNLEELLIVAGLRGKISRVERPRDVYKNWNDLVERSKSIDKYRYEINQDWNRDLAEKTLRQLRGPSGIRTWLLKQA